MHDSPLQTVLQQRDAKPVSGEHLEVLGKHAATQWTTGKCASIHAAVVETIRHEQLSPQQVCRVVEFANQDAYLQEFRKEGSTKVVHFDCGPAVPGEVLQDLNDGGGGSVYDRGTLDYSMHPSAVKHAAAYTGMDKTAAAETPAVPGLTKLPNLPSLPKAASSQYEDQLWALFTEGTKAAMAPSEPMRPLMDVRNKLASARDFLQADINSLELDYADVVGRLYQQVKEAALEGISLSDVVAAWSAVTTDPTPTKLAFAAISPRLRREGVFSGDEMADSLTKRASAHPVNLGHPLVTLYSDFVETLSKLATSRAALGEVEQSEQTATTLLKQGSGLVGAASKGLRAAGKAVDSAAKPVARVLVGSKGAKDLAPVLAGGTKLTALGVGALAANAGLQSVTDRPGTQRALRVAKSITPGTLEYQDRRYRNMSGM